MTSLPPKPVPVSFPPPPSLCQPYLGLAGGQDARQDAVGHGRGVEPSLRMDEELLQEVLPLGMDMGHVGTDGDVASRVLAANGAPVTPHPASPGMLSAGPPGPLCRRGHGGDSLGTQCQPCPLPVPNRGQYLLQGVHPEQGTDAHHRPLVLGQAGHPAGGVHARGVAAVLRDTAGITLTPAPAPWGAPPQPPHPSRAEGPQGAPAHHGDGLLQPSTRRLLHFPALPPVGAISGCCARGVGDLQLEGNKGEGRDTPP